MGPSQMVYHVTFLYIILWLRILYITHPIGNANHFQSNSTNTVRFKMSALEIFDNVWYTKFSPIATICAANVILPNFKITWKCVLFELVMFLGFMSVFWGLYDRELAEGIIGLAGLGSIIQVRTKFFFNFDFIDHTYFLFYRASQST